MVVNQIAHLTIAKGALEELKKDLTVEEKMEYAKLLKILDLNNCPVDSIQQLHDTLAEINVRYIVLYIYSK